MKVKVIKEFNDLQNDLVTRAVNDVYECSEARAEELIKLDYVVAEKPKKGNKNSKI